MFPRKNQPETAQPRETISTASKQLLKRKVLASYHNGLKAKTPTNPKTYGQQTYRRN